MRTIAAVAALVVLALVVGFLLGAGTFANVAPTRPPATPSPRPTASPTPFDPAIVASAVVVPLRSAELAMAITGKVAAVLVEPEQVVALDQVLLRLDASTPQATVDVARADVRRAEAAVDRALIQLDLVPPDASPAQLESAEAELRLAEAELELARSALSEAEVALGQSVLRAPFAGSVVAVETAEGEQATAGEPIVTIADISGWLLETTDMGELEVVRVSVGDRVTITFEALPELELGGVVSRIQVRGTGQEGGVRFGVLIRPDRHVPELLWNMSATVRIVPGT